MVYQEQTQKYMYIIKNIQDSHSRDINISTNNLFEIHSKNSVHIMNT